MRSALPLTLLLAIATAAQGQVTYCRDIGNNKTYCSGGTLIHRHDRTMVITNSAPSQPMQAPALPNPLQQNNALPGMNAPYTAAGTQEILPAPATTLQPVRPAASGAPVVIVPPAGSRVCHQFGTTLVCD